MNEVYTVQNSFTGNMWNAAAAEARFWLSLDYCYNEYSACAYSVYGPTACGALYFTDIK